MLATAGSVQSADGTKLAYRAWPQPGASITFAVVHGLGDHGGRYAHFADGMSKHGMAAYALDLRGHGRSPGQRGHIDSWAQWTDDVAAFVSHIDQVAGTEVVPVGHSFGGAAVLSTILAGKLPASKRFVLSSPALELKMHAPAWKLKVGPIASKIAPRLAMSNEVDPASISTLSEVVDAYRSDPLVHDRISSRMWTEWQNAVADIFQRAGQIKVPFLILAGAADPLIDPHGSSLLHEKTASVSTLRMLEGRYHETFNDRGSDEVFQLIADWVSKK
jgi:alpha-beta hydrolase superfamily lysophospholipase